MRIDLKTEDNSSRKQFVKVKDLDNRELMMMLASYS